MNKQLPSSLSRFAGIILLVFCFANLVAQTCTGNLLTNPGFENGLTGWNTDGGNVTITSTAHSGTKAATVGGTGYGSIGFILPTTPGKNYSFSAWAKMGGAFAFQSVGIRFLDASYINVPAFGTGNYTIGTDYTEITEMITAPVGAAYVYAIAYKDGAGSLTVDDWCLTEQGSTFLPDLTVTNAQIPSTVVIGSPFNFSCIVSNIGLAASTATNLHIEVGNGVDLIDVPVSALSVGQSLSINQQVTIPATEFYGNVGVVTAQIDQPSTVQESNEQNNEAISAPASFVYNSSCNITVSTTPTVCFDLGTPSNPADDSFTFTFTANGSTGTWVATFPDANASGTSTVFSGQNGEVKTVGYFIADVNQFL
ncbi:MAG: carbohydrate binding domain-containing protein, partial [Saprospiraceae bacterium]|nr:carbohydrate binding domain-containing protein [Saprospiraceae bacterium]